MVRWEKELKRQDTKSAKIFSRNDTLRLAISDSLCYVFSNSFGIALPLQKMVLLYGIALFSYEALKTRLEESRFAREGLRDMSGPLIRLDVLSHSEIFVLLQTIRDIHSLHYTYDSKIDDKQIQSFMNEVLNRIGADSLLTPREIVRDFVALLNILHQNPDESFESLLDEVEFTAGKLFVDPEALTPENEINDDENESPYSSFEL